MERWKNIFTCIIYHIPPDWEDWQERTGFNRDMVENKWFVSGYLDIEEALKLTPLGERLPDWIPLGKLPTADKEHQWRY